MKQNLSFDFRGAAVLACALLLATACTQKNSQTQTASQNRTLTAPTGATVSVEPEDGQWTMPAKNYASTRFSGLEDINTGNAASLELAWSFSTGVVRGHEAAPIVANNTMYVVTPFLTGRGNSVAVIDEEQLTLITLIPVGKRAWGIALTPDGRKIYTANGLSKDVTVIETTTNKVIGTGKAGDDPWGIAL